MNVTSPIIQSSHFAKGKNCCGNNRSSSSQSEGSMIDDARGWTAPGAARVVWIDSSVTCHAERQITPKAANLRNGQSGVDYTELKGNSSAHNNLPPITRDGLDWGIPNACPLSSLRFFFHSHFFKIFRFFKIHSEICSEINFLEIFIKNNIS